MENSFCWWWSLGTSEPHSSLPIPFRGFSFLPMLENCHPRFVCDFRTCRPKCQPKQRWLDTLDDDLRACRLHLDHLNGEKFHNRSKRTDHVFERDKSWRRSANYLCTWRGLVSITDVDWQTWSGANYNGSGPTWPRQKYFFFGLWDSLSSGPFDEGQDNVWRKLKLEAVHRRLPWIQ